MLNLAKTLVRHQKIRFIVVGCAGFACNSAALLVFTHFELHKVAAEIIAMIISLQLTFILHDRWTYIGTGQDEKYHRPLKKRYTVYFASNSFGSVLTVVFFSIFSLFLPNILSLAIASVISMFWNYFMNKRIVWRHHIG